MALLDKELVTENLGNQFINQRLSLDEEIYSLNAAKRKKKGDEEDEEEDNEDDFYEEEEKEDNPFDVEPSEDDLIGDDFPDNDDDFDDDEDDSYR